MEKLHIVKVIIYLSYFIPASPNLERASSLGLKTFQHLHIFAFYFLTYGLSVA